METQLALLNWYAAEMRPLPWRSTRDPYAIWVSEIMLQQTQVATVIPYYQRWMERFPTVEALARADEQDVLGCWQGLGYYRRCRSLLAGARWVCEHGMPTTAREWMDVPGVGRYTASAIPSIASGEQVPVVDGNVERVFARLTGCYKSGPELNRTAWYWAEEVLYKPDPGAWNQALMELGATICRPKSPRCAECPVARDCVAFREDSQERLPVAAARPQTKQLRRAAWIHVCGKELGLEQIPDREWWHGMWRFPMSSLEDVEAPVALGVVKHTVTNHRIAMDVFLAKCRYQSESLRWFSKTALDELPLPAPQRRALELALAHA